MQKNTKMKTPVRMILTFFVVVASFYLIIYGPFFFIPGAHINKLFHDNKLLHVSASLIIALSIGVFLWKKTGSISKSLAKYILIGGFIVGAVGFIVGFIGPIILDPSANQGPLLGILILVLWDF